MNPNAFKSWIGQSTTGLGVAALLTTLSAVAAGQVTWQQAIPGLVAGIVGLIWPENKGAQAGASSLAADLIQFIPVISAAVEHGKTIAPAPAPTAEPAKAA